MHKRRVVVNLTPEARWPRSQENKKDPPLLFSQRLSGEVGPFPERRPDFNDGNCQLRIFVSHPTFCKGRTTSACGLVTS